MGWQATITAEDGQGLDVCVPGPRVPSSSDWITYTNPRTQQKETRECGLAAWSGGPTLLCGSDRVLARRCRSDGLPLGAERTARVAPKSMKTRYPLALWTRDGAAILEAGSAFAFPLEGDEDWGGGLPELLQHGWTQTGVVPKGVSVHVQDVVGELVQFHLAGLLVHSKPWVLEELK